MSEFDPAEADNFNLDDDVNGTGVNQLKDEQPTREAASGTQQDYDSSIQEEEEDAYDAIGENAVVNQPQEPDDNLPRYAMSGLLPISLMKQVGNNSWCDFNKRDAAGRTIVNFNWYPAFTLIPIFGGSFEIPFENRPTYSDDPIPPAPFQMKAFEDSLKDVSTKAIRSAKQCADIFTRENKSSGGIILHALTGYHASDADKGFGAARQLVETILPVRDRSVFPVTDRVRAGVPFKGPFLDDLLSDVKRNGLKRLNAAGLSTEPGSVPFRCYQEIRSLLSNGDKRANAFIDESEAEMKKADGIKRGYDPPDLETYDAPVSTDLYCLAHVDRVEVDNKQLRASQNIGEQIADPISLAVNTMTEAIKEMRQAPAAVPAGAIPESQVQSMIAQAIAATRDELSKEFDEKLKAATASASAETVTEPPAGGTGPTGKKGNK
jgi:hypothetical protein